MKNAHFNSRTQQIPCNAGCDVMLPILYSSICAGYICLGRGTLRHPYCAGYQNPSLRSRILVERARPEGAPSRSTRIWQRGYKASNAMQYNQPRVCVPSINGSTSAWRARNEKQPVALPRESYDFRWFWEATQPDAPRLAHGVFTCQKWAIRKGMYVVLEVPCEGSSHLICRKHNSNKWKNMS